MSYRTYLRLQSHLKQKLNNTAFEARETIPTFENCTEKILLWRQETIGVYDVTVQFQLRHIRHIYGCSRKFEIIDLSKQPMRFPQIYLQYDKIRSVTLVQIKWLHNNSLYLCFGLGWLNGECLQKFTLFQVNIQLGRYKLWQVDIKNWCTIIFIGYDMALVVLPYAVVTVKADTDMNKNFARLNCHMFYLSKYITLDIFITTNLINFS